MHDVTRQGPSRGGPDRERDGSLRQGRVECGKVAQIGDWERDVDRTREVILLVL